MTTKADFTPQEWELILEGPPSAHAHREHGQGEEAAVSASERAAIAAIVEALG